VKKLFVHLRFGQPMDKFEEDIKGSIEVGKLDDFVVLDRDYMTCPDRDIMNILPLATIVGGVISI